jgi:hypothetical protein
MSEKEDDLILGEETEGEETPIVDWYEERQDARNDIDTAIYVYNFLDAVDLEGADILRWRMTRKLLRTKKHCLLLICKSVEDLMLEKDEDEED